MEPIKKFCEHSLPISDFRIDRLYDNCQQSGVLEPIVLILYLPLDEREQFFVVVDPLPDIRVSPRGIIVLD